MTKGLSWLRADRPLVIGHRGVRVGAIENTMRAFRAAADAGADGIELDVRLARTGEVVVLHDEDLVRVTRDADPRFARDLSAKELGRVDLDGEGVPLLVDVLAFARERGMFVNVEMKRDVPSRTELVAATARLLHRWAAPVVVSSFDPVMLAAFAAMVPHVATALLVHRSSYHDLMARMPPVVRATGVHPEHVLVDERRMRAWARRAFVCTWTVNSGNEARRLRRLGVSGIITDDPRRILEALSLDDYLPQST